MPPIVPVRSTPAFASLLAIVEQMLRESAGPDVARDFDAAAWLEGWLETPIRRLGGVAPWEFSATPDGFERVQQLLHSEQSGSYW